MHLSSYSRMEEFVRDHLAGRRGAPCRILDVGSMDVNGSYRGLFEDPSWSYTGLDIEPGPNVDIFVNDRYRWKEIPRGSFDVVVSGQALEHVEFPWVLMAEISRVLRPGGLCCLVLPSAGPVHRFPVDCWRFYTDGLRALAHWADLDVLALSVADEEGWSDGSDQWRDAVLVAQRPVKPSALNGMKRYAIRRLEQYQAARRMHPA